MIWFFKFSVVKAVLVYGIAVGGSYVVLGPTPSIAVVATAIYCPLHWLVIQPVIDRQRAIWRRPEH